MAFSHIQQNGNQDVQNYTDALNNNVGCYNTFLNVTIEPGATFHVASGSHGDRLRDLPASAEQHFRGLETALNASATVAVNLEQISGSGIIQEELTMGLGDDASPYASGQNSNVSAGMFKEGSVNRNTNNRRSSWLKSTTSILTSLLRSEQTERQKTSSLYSELDIKHANSYLPKKMDKQFRTYMCSKHLLKKNAIPLWNPAPIRQEGVRGRKRIDVGDVGTFTELGGFQVAFNILLDEKTNDLCGYTAPPNFSRFAPTLSPGQTRKIKDNGEVIDLDPCGAICWVRYYSVACRPLFKGFVEECYNPCQTDESHQFTISPSGGDEKRGYLYLPYGGKRFSFNSKAKTEVMPYLARHIPNWRSYLEGLGPKPAPPPIILTAVWVAKRFACATYTGRPSKSSKAELWSVKGDRVRWVEHNKNFLMTTFAPMDEGYDLHGKLVSDIEDQCFGVEGYVLHPL